MYENGTLKLSEPLPIAEHARVYVSAEDSPSRIEDEERRMWLKTSEETLTRIWDDPDDDVYNELFQG